MIYVTDLEFQSKGNWSDPSQNIHRFVYWHEFPSDADVMEWIHIFYKHAPEFQFYYILLPWKIAVLYPEDEQRIIEEKLAAQIQASDASKYNAATVGL